MRYPLSLGFGRLPAASIGLGSADGSPEPPRGAVPGDDVSARRP